MLIKSGIAPLDERLGGIVAGRPYVLSGAPGTGKSIACLEFLYAALDDGGTVALLTHDDPSDVIAQSEYLGIDFAEALAEERFIIVRYQLDFARKFARTADPAAAFDELTRLIGDQPLQRIAVDSISPIVEAGTASASPITALLNFLDRSGATSLLTHPGDLGGRFDRRLEPLTQRAAGILHLSADRDRRGTLEVQKIRFVVSSTAPISFVIRPGVGLVLASENLTRRADDIPLNARRKILMLSEPNSVPAALLQALRDRFDVAVRARTESGFEDLAHSAPGAVLLSVSRDSIGEAIVYVRDLRRAGSRSPVALVTDFALRSHDRVRALRAGADDFLLALHPEEFLLRVEALVQRGRSTAVVTPDLVFPVPESADGTGILDEGAFRGAVLSQLGSDALSFFTLVQLGPAGKGDVEKLATLARSQIRSDGGDLVGRMDGAVTVYLSSARRKDVDPFVDRLRDAWRSAGHGELEVSTAAHPSEEADMQAMLGAQHA